MKTTLLLTVVFFLNSFNANTLQANMTATVKKDLKLSSIHDGLKDNDQDDVNLVAMERRILGISSNYTGVDSSKSKIIDTVYCRLDSSQTYALFLPSTYSDEKKYPAVFIFEPGARGSLPLKKFREGAEELGYVLISSNNSRNGPFEKSFEAANAMFADAFEKYSLDTSRLYTAGFSGGSRTATAVAVLTGKMAGVIACGAGYANNPAYQPSANHNFHYCGLVGNKDMNFLEHIAVEKDLTKKGLTNTRLIFNLSHQWPPSSFLKKALYWMELQAYKNNKMVSTSFSATNALHIFKTYADSIQESGNYSLAAESYQNIINDFKNIVSLEEIISERDQLIASKEYRKHKQKLEKIYKKEASYHTEIIEALNAVFYSKIEANNAAGYSIDWWKSKIDYFKRIEEKKSVEKSNMAARLLNMIWANCAEWSFESEILKNYKTAISFNEIWLYVQPSSLWANWNIARLYSITDQTDKMLTHLKRNKSNNPNFSLSRVENEKAFCKHLDLILENL